MDRLWKTMVSHLRWQPGIPWQNSALVQSAGISAAPAVQCAGESAMKMSTGEVLVKKSGLRESHAPRCLKKYVRSSRVLICLVVAGGAGYGQQYTSSTSCQSFSPPSISVGSNTNLSFTVSCNANV